MPEMYGTHHTKMIVLLRHDDQAQVIIHTANLIPKDWTNMTQAVWRSPLLPIQLSEASQPLSDPPIGSGHRFKIDFLNYLSAYDRRRAICKPLIEQLTKYDFSKIRGALIGSVPGRHSAESDGSTKWGWQALRYALNSVPVQQGGHPEVVIQISSIATLGQTNQWLEKTFFKSLSASKSQRLPVPAYKIIFPTADEIRRSLDGYQSGSSIHARINSPAQIKQFQYLKPLLHHWAGDVVEQASGMALHSLSRNHNSTNYRQLLLRKCRTPVGNGQPRT
jgi:Tyrosyl-DNA phosphodiesterase